MTGSRRSRRLAAFALTTLSAVLACPAPALAQDSDASRAFEQGLALLRRGDDEGALAEFRRVLAADPTSEDAYRLWRETEADVWQDLLRRQGQFQLVTERIMSLAAVNRSALERDGDAIREKLSQLADSDPISRRQQIAALRGQHGEFAVPLMLGALAEDADEERRASFMIALADLGPRAVPPLIAALDAPNPTLRRNVALTLGRLGDRRAKGPLAALLETDPDQGVRAAAQTALQFLGGTGGQGALELLVADASAYLGRDLTIVGPGLSSDVVWNWTGGRLTATEVPPAIYPDEMARQTLFRAIAVDPASPGALGNLARAGARMGVELERLELRGEEPGATGALAERALLSAAMLDVAALDAGLGAALEQSDIAGAVGLVRMIGARDGSGSEGLRSALIARFPQIREEAAIAAASVAARTGQGASEAVVSLLGGAAARVVQRSALIIDADGARADTLAQALRNRGMVVQVAPRAALGLTSLRRSPGVDLVIVADRLPDLTVDQVLADARTIPQAAETPLLVVSDNADEAEELYSERAAGILSSPDDLPTIEQLLEGSLNLDREEAKLLAARAADALGLLAGSGNAISGAADELAANLASMQPEVLAPAMNALGLGGEARHSGALIEVLSAGERDEAERIAAADALSGIFGRTGVVADEATFAALEGLLSGEELSVGLQHAIGGALGSMGLPAQTRGALLRQVEAPIVLEGSN